MNKKWLFILLFVVLLAGCGGPKADISLFVMTKGGVTGESAIDLEKTLQTKLGDSPTVQLSASPIFSVEKLMLEVAAGDHSIIIVPEEQFKAFGSHDGYVELDDIAKMEDYPEGVLEITEKTADGEKTKKHVYGIPVHKLKWFTDAGYKSDSALFAFIPQKAGDIEKAKQVLKVIMTM